MRAAFAHLRLVEPEARSEAVDIREEEKVHSLHSVFPSRFIISPVIADYLIKRFSKAGDVVLDPLCKAGTVPLASHILHRVSWGIERHPLWVSISEAKISPSDLANVALKTQLLPLRKPVSLEQYRKYFYPFFDPSTYCELINLQNALRADGDKTSRFVELLTISLLHGPSAGFLSVPTSAFGVGSPDHQESINRQKKASPEYRALSPRLLKKAAMALTDSLPSVARKVSMNHKIAVADPRNASQFASQSVDLSITEVSSSHLSSINEQWLRCWFLGISPNVSAAGEAVDSLEDWNAILMELTRLVKSSGRAIFVFNRAVDSQLIKSFLEMVQRDLNNYWSYESEIQFPSPKVQIGSTRGSDDKVAIVFRRKG